MWHRGVQDKIEREAQAREAQKAAEEQAAADRNRAAAERAAVVAQHALLSQPEPHGDAADADQPYDPESVPWDGSVMMNMDFDDDDADAGDGSPEQEVLSISEPGSPPAQMARRMEEDMRMSDAAAEPALGAGPKYEPPGGGRGWVEPGASDRDATPPLTDAQRAALPGAGGARPAAGAADSQRSRRTSGSGSVGNDGGAAFKHVEDLAPLVLTTPEGQAGGGAPGVRLWTGFIEFFGDGLTMRAELASLQGSADLASVVRGAIVVKGTLATTALVSFFEQLVNSRSRTVSLGVLRVSKKGLDESSLERINKVGIDALAAVWCRVSVSHVLSVC